MVSSGEARKSGSSPVPAQGVLFAGDLPELDEEVGYRGPTACKAAGITYRQLDYWARTGLVEPSVRPAGGSGTQRLYGFRDILVLKIVKRLLDTGVSLQQIRIAIAVLRSRGVDDLAQITLMSDGASVYECTSNDEVIDLLQGGQGVFGIAVGKVWREVEGELASLPSERAEHEAAAPDEPRPATSSAPAAPPASPDPDRTRRPRHRADACHSACRRARSPPPGGRFCSCRSHRAGESSSHRAGAPKGQTSPEPLRRKGPHGTGTSGAPSPRRVTEGETSASPSPRSTVSTSTTDLPAFAGRHIGPREEDVAAMLEVVGRASLDDLVDTAVPGGIRGVEALDIEPAASEAAVLEELRQVAARNRRVTSMIGLGYYGTLDARPSSSATCSRTRPGTPPTRPTSRRSRRAGSRPCSTSRPSSPTSPACRSRAPRSSTSRPPPPRR